MCTSNPQRHMVQHARYLARAASAVITMFFFSLSRTLNSPLKRMSAVYVDAHHELMLPINCKSERRKNLIYELSHEYCFPCCAFCFALHFDFFAQNRREKKCVKKKDICLYICLYKFTFTQLLISRDSSLRFFFELFFLFLPRKISKVKYIH